MSEIVVDVSHIRFRAYEAGDMDAEELLLEQNRGALEAPITDVIVLDNIKYRAYEAGDLEE